MKELRILLFQRALYNYQAVMYLKKEISISFLIITISASNLYMPMIWSYVILLDFLIPFLCGPDLQCGSVPKTKPSKEVGPNRRLANEGRIYVIDHDFENCKKVIKLL